MNSEETTENITNEIVKLTNVLNLDMNNVDA